MSSLLAAVLLLLAGESCQWNPLGPSPAANVNMSNASIDALDVLRQSADDKDVVVRANAIEALAQTVGDKEGGLYLQAMSDSNPLVQFTAAMALGDVRYAPAKEALQKIAREEGPDKRVYAAVIYALYRLGDESQMNRLPKLWSHREAEVRAAAALILGKMGESSGIRPLTDMLTDEKDAKVELQIIESLAMLGDPRGKSQLEAYTRRPFLDERLVAIPAMARTHADRALLVLNEMVADRQPVPVRVAAAGALALLGNFNSSNYNLCLKGVEDPYGLLRASIGRSREINPNEITLVQRLAIISMGYMNRPEAVGVLMPLLKSPEGSIRVAAAMSILRIAGPPRPAGPAAATPEPRPIATTAPQAVTLPQAVTALPGVSAPGSQVAAKGPTSQPSPVTQPVTQPATQPAGEPATQPASQPAAQAVTLPMPQPVTQPLIQPATLPAPQPSPVAKATPVPAPASAPVATKPADANAALPSLNPQDTPRPKPRLKTAGAKE